MPPPNYQMNQLPPSLSSQPPMASTSMPPPTKQLTQPPPMNQPLPTINIQQPPPNLPTDSVAISTSTTLPSLVGFKDSISSLTSKPPPLMSTMMFTKPPPLINKPSSLSSKSNISTQPLVNGF